VDEDDPPAQVLGRQRVGVEPSRRALEGRETTFDPQCNLLACEAMDDRADQAGFTALCRIAHECRLAQWLEGRAHLFREVLGLFPGGEVTTLVHLVEVDDVVVGLLDPAARGPPDLARERSEADRDRDRRGCLAGSLY